MARSLNGGTDQIVSTYSSAPAVRSVSLWLWLNGLPASSNRYYDDTDAGSFGSFHGNNAAGTIYLDFSWSGSGGHAEWITTSATVTTGQWYALGMSYDSTSASNAPKFYINGSSVSVSVTNAAVGSAQLGSATAITVGNVGGVKGVNGLMADFAMWSGILLSDAEFAALAQGIRPSLIRPTSLKLWLPLDGLQSPEPDFSGNANNGTLTGTALAAGPPSTPITRRWPQSLDISLPPFLVYQQQTLAIPLITTGNINLGVHS